MTIREAIDKVVRRLDLTRQEVEDVWMEIMTGKAQDSQIASLLTALRMKGETVEEITGAALVMRKFVIGVNTTKDVLLDTCGTGGDGRDTFNISSISALVAAGAGICVAKHGNRSVSSKCGSADLLEALGVKIDLPKEKVEACIEKVGMGFLFAPNLHPAMKYATPVRRKIGIRTIFNILGPLTNPAGAGYQLLGVYDRELVEPLVRVLANLGSIHCLVVHGLDGLDEVTTTGATLIGELKGGSIRTYKIKPEDFGIKRVGLGELRGGDVSFNVNLAQDILAAKPGPARDVVLLNAGCAIYAAEAARDIKEGIALAAESIDKGKAKEKLEELRRCSKGEL
jgi:anthranilate phosphoribosyltransferase